MRLPFALLLVLAAVLIGAAPAFAGALVSVSGDALSFDGTLDQSEPVNVTISQAGDVLRLDELASRMTAQAPCVLSFGGYRAECPAAGVERIVARTSDPGSDVRVRADLPAEIHGGAGDDVLIGGPANDTIDGGAGQDVIGGGPSADVLRGGPGVDLVTYADRIASDGTIAARHDGIGVHVAIGAPGASGEPLEGDTIGRDVEQLEGTPYADRFDLRDGQADAVACDGGRDLVVADPLDDPSIDCETTRVAPAPGQGRLAIPTLVFPFTGHASRGGGRISVSPLLPLQHGAIVVRVKCPVAIGLLDLDGPGCSGRVRFARAGAVLSTMGIRNIVRGHTITLKLPLTSSRRLAQRASGLPVTVTAIPSLGAVQRLLTFTVRG
jgi:RTX calcium-binding nonapeptide repeat (4 copies)